MSKPDKIPSLVKRVAQPLPVAQPKLSAPAVARSGAETMAAMDRINSDKSIEYQVMNERGPRFEPQPSERNSAGQAVNLFDMTFSDYGARHFGGSNYMRSRRVG
jgi:hypothetical protein